MGKKHKITPSEEPKPVPEVEEPTPEPPKPVFKFGWNSIQVDDENKIALLFNYIEDNGGVVVDFDVEYTVNGVKSVFKVINKAV